ncbi:MAG: D-alanine--D-alanine ligase family protein [Trueperella sp.]|nr:D-alanine--D-alanine ligase family protein [Trueperella sp.]
MENKKIRIALIYGGVSGEHSISCATAGAVMDSLDPQRYEVIPIAIQRDGTWVPGTDNPEELKLSHGLYEVGESDRRVVIPAGNGSQPFLDVSSDATNLKLLQDIDVVFPLLHGPFGEDGTIQGLLEMSRIPYVGCGVFASAAGMDKHYMKIVLEAAGLPVGPYVAFTASQWRTGREKLLAQIAELEYPLYVKPARAGSSIGITRIDSLAELDDAVAAAQEHDPKVVVEQGIVGREIECAVLEGRGDDPARASVLGEVLLSAPKSDFYDFEAKYLNPDGLEMSVPAQLPADMAQQVRELAVRAFDAFGCEGMARVDFFVSAENISIIEINTIPGFTPFSMYPVLWEHTGMPYSQLLDELIWLALNRPVGLR